jgi:replicative DNA helicase
VFLSRLRTGDIEDSQWSFLVEAANALSDNNLIIIDRPRYKKIENLVALTESLAMESPLSLIIIDHIQRMRTQKKFQSRHLELSYISEELSSLAKDCNVPLLILCQLNREVEKRNDKHPRLYDMKESGDLEANADVVIGLYRANKESELLAVEALKGRDTGTWKTCLTFDRKTQKITDCKNPEMYEPLSEEVPERGYDG